MLPGVTGVDIGLKIVNGKKTDVMAIRVYVDKKMEDVDENIKIPKEIRGVPTDVIQRKFVLHPTESSCCEENPRARARAGFMKDQQ